MVDLYTSKYMPNRREKHMVKCPKCGHSFKIELECNRCGHKWTPRKPNDIPKVCAKCKSPYWNKPRQNNNARNKNE